MFGMKVEMDDMAREQWPTENKRHSDKLHPQFGKYSCVGRHREYHTRKQHSYSKFVSKKKRRQRYDQSGAKTTRMAILGKYMVFITCYTLGLENTQVSDTAGSTKTQNIIYFHFVYKKRWKRQHAHVINKLFRKSLIWCMLTNVAWFNVKGDNGSREYDGIEQ